MQGGNVHYDQGWHASVPNFWINLTEDKLKAYDFTKSANRA